MSVALRLAGLDWGLPTRLIHGPVKCSDQRKKKSQTRFGLEPADKNSDFWTPGGGSGGTFTNLHMLRYVQIFDIVRFNFTTIRKQTQLPKCCRLFSPCRSSVLSFQPAIFLQHTVYLKHQLDILHLTDAHSWPSKRARYELSIWMSGMSHKIRRLLLKFKVSA